MCGRFSQSLTWQDIKSLYSLPNFAEKVPSPKTYNGAPTQEFTLCRLNDNRLKTIELLSWGLVPYWAKDTKMRVRLINARSETVHEKPAFRSAFHSRRCLIPANGWFEWRQSGNGKQPFFITYKNASPISFAGIWDRWIHNGKLLETFSIITTKATPSLAEIHPRQPVVVNCKDFEDWLDPKTSVIILQEIISPRSEDLYEICPVSNKVNKVLNNTPDILERYSQNTLF